MKLNKITLFAIAFLFGSIVTVLAIEIGDNLSGFDFKNLDVETENWCRNIDVEKSTDNIIYWYECKEVIKVNPSNYSVEGRTLQRGYPIEDYNNCIGRGNPDLCLATFYDEQALLDVRQFVLQLREDITRKQRQAIISREFPPNTERFSQEQINN